jgi:hypothetical protein
VTEWSCWAATMSDFAWWCCYLDITLGRSTKVAPVKYLHSPAAALRLLAFESREPHVWTRIGQEHDLEGFDDSDFG